ncbi:expressed unknown protein [Seminavis robusta]|uniref:C6H2-type domain-containing protein n=1 Tax=Seminavis robusta TaxID=568900 RepID=A0A9N8E7M8_9STRA|nr:expressed unknown protein [Seminavis robusta]|eukprot:Sro740_g195510.1 n/a (422) ;mRNA; f:18080-19345
MTDTSTRCQDVKTRRVTRVCWGCHTNEAQGDRFKQCPLCAKNGFVPALFCSQACFKKSWPDHKQWHKNEGAKAKDKLTGTAQKISSRSLHLEPSSSEYQNLLNESNSKVAEGDFNSAKKILQKAQKIDPARPQAYLILGTLYQTCEESKSCYEQGCQRSAILALANTQVDNHVEQEKSDITYWWALSVSGVFIKSFELDSSRDNHCPKPNSWRHDGMFKRITKVALDGYWYNKAGSLCSKLVQCKGPSTFTNLAAMRAFALFACFRDDESSPLKRTAEELEELTALRYYVSENDKGLLGFFFRESAAAKINANVIDEADSTALERGEAGLWVVIHGLESQAGQAMNGKFGLVCTDGLEDGRVTVKVEGMDGWKRIRPDKNLVEVPFSEEQVALISTIEENDQWKFVKSSLELREALCSMAE